VDKINAYYHDPKNQIHWKEEVYLSDDFLEKMLAEKKEMKWSWPGTIRIKKGI
jgi:hypothetical protein